MKLTSKAISGIQILNRFDNQDLTSHLEEYHKLLDTLLYLNETLAESKSLLPHWKEYSETLLFKFCNHGFTLHNILKGVTLNSIYYPDILNGKELFDISSSNVILRSQFEAFLMYHHIYVNPKLDEEKELRHHAWIYSSLMQRLDFNAESPYGKEQRKVDIEQMEIISQRIKSLSAYKQLSYKQQKSLLSKGSGKLFKHWSTILEETGFSKSHPFYTLYTYLSMYSHSEGLSVIQLKDNLFKKNLNNEFGSINLKNSKMLVSAMITTIVKLFPIIEIKYNTLPSNLKNEIETYSQIMVAKY